MTIAIYAGTFDPFTLGHEDVLNRARQIFDEVIVAVAADTGKNTFFSFEERVDLAQKVLKDVSKVRVVGFEGLLSEFVKATGASVLIRGVRNGSDFDYETRMACVNHVLNKGVQTVFFPPMNGTQSISGSLVREIHRLGGDVSAFVNPIVCQALEAKRSGAR
jgi:pantetheine-phosphate adenylyltransferase